MSVLRKFCYYSRWQYCHLGHTTCSTFRNYSLCLVAWKWFCYWKDCNKVSAYAKLFSTVLQRTSFPMGSYQEVLVNNPHFFHQTFQKDLQLLIFCLAQSQPKFPSTGNLACYRKTRVARYFSFEFMLFVDRDVMHWSTLFFLINGKHLEGHLNFLHLEMSIY